MPNKNANDIKRGPGQIREHYIIIEKYLQLHRIYELAFQILSTLPLRYTRARSGSQGRCSTRVNAGLGSFWKTIIYLVKSKFLFSFVCNVIFYLFHLGQNFI